MTLQNKTTLCSACNEFGYSEQIFYVKIINNNVKRLVTTSNWL